MKILATFVIAALIGLVIAAPSTPLGRRGSEMKARLEAPAGTLSIGDPFPALGLQRLDGMPLDLSALRGHRVLITFERSVDW